MSKRKDKEAAPAPVVPNPSARRREAIERTVKRTASGSVLIANGKFVMPRDKRDLNSLD